MALTRLFCGSHPDRANIQKDREERTGIYRTRSEAATAQGNARITRATSASRSPRSTPTARATAETLQCEAGSPIRHFPAETTPYGSTFHSFEPVPLTRTPETPLAGQPLKLDANGPHQDLRDTARSYMLDACRSYNPGESYLDIDPARAKAIADAYEAMPHTLNDPAVQKPYGALAKETLDQYAAIKRDGYSFDFYPRGEGGEIVDPYPSPFDALRDIRGDAKHMKVYPTDDGYGAAGITDDMVAENPMLALVPGETWGAKPVRVNDVFRAVHDAFGHAKDGVGFRAAGEENAWNSHRSMYSPEAQRAMTTARTGKPTEARRLGRRSSRLRRLG